MRLRPLFCPDHAGRANSGSVDSIAGLEGELRGGEKGRRKARE